MIYLDSNSTTELDPEVLDTIISHLKNNWGNPSSSYFFGSREKSSIERARSLVASLINVESNEVIFTSCATESNSTVFNTIFEKFDSEKKRIITTKVEHSSVLENCKLAESKGFDVVYLNVNKEGMLNFNELKNSLTDTTCLVSIMWANNETGVIFPVEEIAQLCSDKEILFHCDAVQAAGKIPIDLSVTNIDYLSISAHKLHGPKGIGALYVKSGNPLSPLIIGGGQENKMRGGTYNAPYISGFGKAAELAKENLSDFNQKMSKLRDEFEEGLLKLLPKVYFNGKGAPRLANVSNFGIPGMDSDIISNILANQEIYVSTGSACKSDAISPSHVITAMKGYEHAGEALRISFSLRTPNSAIVKVLKEIAKSYSLLS